MTLIKKDLKIVHWL